MTSPQAPSASAPRAMGPWSDGTVGAPGPGSAISPPPLRHGRGLLGAAVALVAGGGLLAAWLYVTAVGTEPVLALRADVARGDTVGEADLVVAQLSADPLLDTVPAERLGEVVGQVATIDLPAGSLLPEVALASEVAPAPGTSLVAITLPGTGVPSSGVRAGDRVRVVDTPRLADDPPAVEPTATEAAVARVNAVPDTADVVLDLAVPRDAAAALAARVATGRVALVLDGPSGDRWRPDGDGGAP